MRVKTSFPRSVRVIENTWIPLSDGVRLAARIWLPEDAEQQPVPAILEFLPYRKNDFTAYRDAIQHPYFAGHGYASVRVDMRGAGDSDGVLYDEYLKQEQDDALEVLAWIARQPWCTGAVGIIGISWGGFNGLQIAARRPPQLKAVITLCSTDDRYADDVHYVGGCLLAANQLAWASTMLAGNARPPDPINVGEAWREKWLNRLEKTPPFVEAWMTHQRRDAFWKHGSACEDFSAITCAVFAVGGWADGYTNAVPRLLAGLTAPRKGLIGPWAHLYPEMGVPGPAIGFLQECLRWWDYWLKGEDTGIMDEPTLRAWLLDSLPPSTHYVEWPGRWVAEPEWPSPKIKLVAFALDGSGGLVEQQSDTATPETRLAAGAVQRSGLAAGQWCPHGMAGDMPPDQREEDALSLTFTSAPLASPIEILGFPEVALTVASDRPNALIAVRLCDVRPDGASALISRGLLNLTHRESHEHPTPLEPGRAYAVTVRLNVAGYSVPAGHRLRLAISPNYWPWAWPSPEAVTLTLTAGAHARLTLPVRPPRPEDAELRPLEPAEGAEPLRADMLRPASRDRQTRWDTINNSYTIQDQADVGRRRLRSNGLEYESRRTDIYTVTEGDPLSARAECVRDIEVARGAWQTRVHTSSSLACDAHNFIVSNSLEVFEGDSRVFNKTWNFTVARDLV